MEQLLGKASLYSASDLSAWGSQSCVEFCLVVRADATLLANIKPFSWNFPGRRPQKHTIASEGTLRTESVWYYHVVTCVVIACAGNPKGVVLSHSNVLATIAALQTYVKEVGLDVHEDDSTLSYLTLAHIFGRALEEFALSLGASVGYWSVSHQRLPLISGAWKCCSLCDTATRKHKTSSATCKATD